MASKKYIYEVRCLVPENLSVNFAEWLKDHIDDMTSLPYFLDAETFQGEALESPHMHLFVAHYILRSRQDLQEYLANTAPQMRSKLPAEFQGQIAFSRGVLTQIP